MKNNIFFDTAVGIVAKQLKGNQILAVLRHKSNLQAFHIFCPCHITSPQRQNTR